MFCHPTELLSRAAWSQRLKLISIHTQMSSDGLSIRCPLAVKKKGVKPMLCVSFQRVSRRGRMDTGPPMANVAEFAYTLWICLLADSDYLKQMEKLMTRSLENNGNDGGIWPWSYSTINIPPCFSEVWWPFACFWPRTATLRLQRRKVKRRFFTADCSELEPK